MSRFAAFCLMLVSLALATPSLAQGLGALEGATIVGADGQFLGLVTSNSLDPDSLSNSVGRYGSSVSPTSIFNSVGRYGSSVSPDSAFNSMATNPPRIITRDNRWAWLTTNTMRHPRIDPYLLVGLMRR